MISTLSVYWDPWHSRPGDELYIKTLRPAWIVLHQPTARAIWRAQELAPAAKLLLRSWDIDDNHGAAKRELYDDPVSAAHTAVARWEALLGDLSRELQRNAWAYDPTKWWLQLWNEPDPAYLDRAVRGTEAALALADQRGHRLGVGVASVGNFRLPGEAEPNWTLFKALERPIHEGGHVLVVHEYWQPEGPDAEWVDEKGQKRRDAGFLAWRHRHIPLDVPILVGEAGVNGFIYGRYADQDNAGWQRFRHDPRFFLTPEKYAAQVQQYIRGCDSRVCGVCLYMTDYHSDQWRTFDTEPAHGPLLAIKKVTPLHGYLPITPKPGPSQPDPVPSLSLIPPVAGPITQRWGENPERYQRTLGIPYHNGTDYGAPQGAPVVAVADGTVAYVGVDEGYGNYVRLWHPQLGFCTFYAHLEASAVEPGERVKQGQAIGRCGSTGNSTGPHVHFEVRLASDTHAYRPGTYGHAKGRVDPETVMGVLNGR